ncbi:MAG: cadherin-like domain-containing protein [Limnothrix sp. RL_2_0]|nr:cadherin-like domain-containing protein [Limnothrix sp. RL_2_0]
MTDEDSSFTTGNVLANDKGGENLIITGLNTSGTQGTVTNNGDGTFNYDPNGQFESLAEGETATDTFFYTIENSDGVLDTAAVTVTINGLDDTLILEGTGGNDILTGTNADEIFIGLRGRDTLTGGSGKDKFVFTSTVDAGDTITDFEVGSDLIVFTDLFESIGFEGLDPISAGVVGFLGSGDNTIITIDPDGIAGGARARSFLSVEGVSVENMKNADNFVF